MIFSLIIETAEDRAKQAIAALQTQISAAIDAQVETQAQALGYNSAAACVGYIGSSVSSWAEEAQAFIVWRDAVWTAAYRLLEKHRAEKSVPSVADALAALPVWGK
jgi:hypothetical protein